MVEEEEEEEMEKSSGLNREKILNNHRQFDNEYEPWYPRRAFRRDPKSQTEFLISRTGPYQGQSLGIKKRTGVRGRTGIGRKGGRKISPAVQRRQSPWDSGKTLFL